MSLEAILETILTAGNEQVREIEARAQSQVYQTLANARMKAEEIRESACAEAAAPAARERARILHHARLEALQSYGGVRESLVDTALERIRGRLAGLRTDQSYPQVYDSLVREALDEIQGSLEETGEIYLEVDPRDQALIEKITPELSAHLSVEYKLHCWGGLVAKSKDGRAVVINTLESRFERATPYLRKYLAAAFDSERDDQWQTTTMATPA